MNVRFTSSKPVKLNWILTLALRTPPKRRMSAERRFPHDHKPGPLQVAHDALRGNGGHVFGGVVLSLATFKPEREGDRIGKVARIDGRQIVGQIGHWATIARR
jgi:hypothetical protein